MSAKALTELSSFRPLLHYAFGDKLPTTLKTARRDWPHLPIPLVQAELLNKWVQAKAGTAALAVRAQLEWCRSTLAQLTADHAEGAAAECDVRSARAALEAAELKLASLSEVTATHTNALVRARRIRDGVLSAHDARTMAYIYGFTYSDEDAALELRRPPRLPNLRSQEAWQENADILNPLKYRTSTFVGTGRRGFLDHADLDAHQQELQKYAEEMDRHERDNERRAARGLPPRKFKLKRPRIDDKQPTLSSPESVIELSHGKGIMFTESGNHWYGPVVSRMSCPLLACFAIFFSFFLSFCSCVPNRVSLLLPQQYHSLRFRSAADGQVSTIIGKEEPGQSSKAGHVDGIANQARLNSPHGLCQLHDGSILIADTANHCIRLLDARFREVATIAGRPDKAGHANGKGNAALFQAPFDVLAISEPGTRGDVVYISDRDDSTLRRLTLQRDGANQVGERRD
jgi:hypothetical protein